MKIGEKLVIQITALLICVGILAGALINHNNDRSNVNVANIKSHPKPEIKIDTIYLVKTKRDMELGFDTLYSYVYKRDSLVAVHLCIFFSLNPIINHSQIRR